MTDTLMKTNSSPGKTRRVARPARSARQISKGVAKTSVIEPAPVFPSLLQLKSIVVPIDFSPTANKALAYAVRLADQFGGKLTLIHVVQPVAVPEFAAVSLLIENDDVKTAALARLDTLLNRLKVPSRLVDRRIVRFGTPFAEITSAAKSLKADVIVLTTHGYTGLKHALLGSTAERVVRHAPCPVFTVRDKAS